MRATTGLYASRSPNLRPAARYTPTNMVFYATKAGQRNGNIFMPERVKAFRSHSSGDTGESVCFVRASFNCLNGKTSRGSLPLPSPCGLFGPH